MAKDQRQVDAITARDVDFAQWYTDVCKKAELIDYTSVSIQYLVKTKGRIHTLKRGRDKNVRVRAHGV